MDRKEFIRALATAKIALESKHYIPALTNFFFDHSTVSAYNGAQAVVVDFESPILGGVHGETFYKIVNSFCDETVDVFQKDLELTIKSGKSRTVVGMLDSKEYTFRVKQEELEKSSLMLNFIPNEEFLKGIELCMSSINKNPAIVNQFGVNLYNSKDGATLFSTDGKRISEYKLPSISDVEFKTLLPENFCKMLVNLAKSRGIQAVNIYDTLIYVRFEGVSLFSSLIKEVKYLDFDGIINKYPARGFQEVPIELASALSRAAVVTFTNAYDRTVKVSLEGQMIYVNAKGDIGEVSDEIECKIPFNDTIIASFETPLLQTAVNDAKEMAFVRSRQTGNSIFVGKSDNYTHYLMMVSE